ncbi:MAG: NAD-dependent epimerase/dehydratase family protein [Bacteroidales bacterium]|jgi:UDP-glucuronate 4-epimerase|nr:NAD-dependent epimerase/dehydratase family protein [Bacteroidales bacterium]
MKRILLTGAAGFIGFHTVKKLVQAGHAVTGIDNINNYYDPVLKYARLKECGINRERIKELAPIQSSTFPGYTFIKFDLKDRENSARLFSENNFDLVIHLAAQPGARHSLIDPFVYIDSNIEAFINILEGCRHQRVKHLVFASSSSVYGNNPKQPSEETDFVDHPISLYAATKKANELMAHTYSAAFGIPVTGLRFFTVYGPWGRPDMAYYKFARAIDEGLPIEVFNGGSLERDFTYIEDIIEGLVRITDIIPDGMIPYRLFNIGHSEPVKLLRFIEIIEENLGKKAVKVMKPMQPGDVLSTYAGTALLERYSGYKPETSIEEGIKRFVDWYKSYGRKI